jgi:nicotinamidase/pyrazinamidase
MPALVVIDIQNDFCSGGALAVPGAEEILPLVNRMMDDFEHVVLTQDWHPPGHVSFASSHPGGRLFERLALPCGEQLLWPDHCVAGTSGADFHPGLSVPAGAAIVRKGVRRELDSYSAFFENDAASLVGLDELLLGLGVQEIVLAGLATDFCVLHTALDGRRLGYDVRVVEAACRGIGTGGSLAAAWARMHAAGVERV